MAKKTQTVEQSYVINSGKPFYHGAHDIAEPGTRVTVEVTVTLDTPEYEVGDNVPTCMGEIPLTGDELQTMSEYALMMSRKCDENAALIFALLNKYVMPEINELCGHRFAEPLPGTLSQFRGYTIHVTDHNRVQQLTPEL